MPAVHVHVNMLRYGEGIKRTFLAPGLLSTIVFTGINDQGMVLIEQSGIRGKAIHKEALDFPVGRPGGDNAMTAQDLSLIHISEPTRPY